MNTLTTFEPPQNKVKAPLETTDAAVAEQAWYQGREMGMAYCRLTEQLAAQPGTKIDKELRSLERALQQDIAYACWGDGANLIDLGTGDGQKMVIVIKALNAAGVRAVRYVPVDTNPYIARYAILTVMGFGTRAWNRSELERMFGPLGGLALSDGPAPETFTIDTHVRLSKSQAATADLFVRHELVVPLTGLQIDFFQDLRSLVSEARLEQGNRMNIFCLLGNTFGNYSAEKRDDFIATLYREMNVGDLFLLGISLRPKDEASAFEAGILLENEYAPGKAFMRLAADDPRSTFFSRYDPASYCMRHGFERPDRSVQDLGYSQLFDAAEVVRTLESARFEVVAREAYPSPGFSDALSARDAEPRYLTLLVRKAR
jgi:hypothetical protein